VSPSSAWTSLPIAIPLLLGSLAQRGRTLLPNFALPLHLPQPVPQAPSPVLRPALQGRVRRGVCERTPFLLGCAVRSSSAAEACIHPSRSSRVVCPGVLHGHLAARAPSVAASSAGSASVQGDLVIRRGYDRARAQRAGGAALRGPAHWGRGMTKLSVY
jgi:hypothetical protein